MKAYSLKDLETANIILSTPLDTLYNMDFYSWARAVKAFFASLYRLAKSWSKSAGSYTLAIKAIWSNLRTGMSIADMARKATDRVNRLMFARLPEGMMMLGDKLVPMNRKQVKKNSARGQQMTSRASKGRMWMGNTAKGLVHRSWRANVNAKPQMA